MAIAEAGVDYFRSLSVLTLSGNSTSLTVAQLGLLAGSVSGTVNGIGVVTTTSVGLNSGSADNNLNVGETFTLNRTVVTDPLIGETTTANTAVNLTMVGSGTFSNLVTGTTNVIVGVDGTGAQYLVFPDGDMPSGLLGGVVGSLLNTLTLDTVGYNFTTNAPLCFGRGTMIATPQGPRAIETLKAGDLVLTRDNDAMPIRWIAGRTITQGKLARQDNLRPIVIRAGALGDNMPAADLIVSPQHRILVRSRIAQKMFGAAEVLVAAKQLLILDGVDICDTDAGVEYFHMLFDRHEVVFANGAEAESLYTGPEALKSVGAAALAEIFEIFPELRDADHIPESARVLASGRLGRRLVARHVQHGKPLLAMA